ncbi:MAG TPA: Fic family protein [Thermoanaerobaculia bacterium]
MPEDTSRMEPTSLAQGDRLYQGFPDFSAWGKLPPEDVDLWSRFAAGLEERRREASPETLKAAVEVAVRAAALDTGAIEGLYSVDRGFTMTVAVQGLAWQQMIEERGAGVRELFEAQLAAYELVLDAVTHRLPITEAWIRSLHETLCAPQKMYRVLTEVGWQEQELPKGQYKTRPNHVLLTDGTIHAYAPVDRVPDEMHRLIEQIRTPEFEAAHPVLQASYCHYAFVVIHPFADGNGRVARALASTFFYKAQSIPLVIFENQRPAYLDSLRAADSKDFKPVTSFFWDRGIDTMQLVSESLMTAVTPDLENLAIRLNPLVKGTLSSEEIGNVSRRLLSEIDEQLRTQAQKLVSYNLILRESEPFASSPHSIAQSLPEFSYPSGYSLEIKTHRSYLTVLVEFTNELPFPFIVRIPGSSDVLALRLQDVRTELSEAVKLRLSQWVQRRLAKMLIGLESRLQPKSDELDLDLDF